MPRKRQTSTGQLDPEVMKEIEKQTRKQQKIDNKRTKQRLIFWSIIIFGTTIAIAVGILLLGLVGKW